MRIFRIIARTLVVVLPAISVFHLTSCGGDETLTEKPLPPVERPTPPKPDEPATLGIVDPDATPETKALLGNLWRVGREGKYMFGHHDDLLYGRAWNNIPGRSDTKDVCGEYPAVYSIDFAYMIDYQTNGNPSIDPAHLRTIKEAYSRGEVITACMHINNPNPNGGDAWDNSVEHSVWPDIITSGTPTNTRFLGWLDNFADMAGRLKDDSGKLIPILFRPFHEHTEKWSWWGANSTDAQFIELWQMTIKYLRDTKGVHNFLYAISPQMDADYGYNTRSRLLYRWPGDRWVDFFGMDCYHGLGFNALKSNLGYLEQVAAEKLKPCGVTETGLEGFSNTDYWTKGIVEPFTDKKVSMVVMWRNHYTGDINSPDRHFFSVYKGHPSEDDFRKMFNESSSLFGGDLAGKVMYLMPEGYVVE
jgi:hypothetical protein